MSNCVDIEDYEKVLFNSEDINVSALKELIDTSEKEVTPKTSVSDNVDVDKRIAWWFLNKNTIFYENAVLIHFGEGRSTHTFRDLQSTIIVLQKFMKSEKTHRFLASEEGDGFMSKFYIDVNFTTGQMIC